MNREEQLNISSTPTHCIYCFDIVQQALSAEDPFSIEFPPLPDTIKKQEAPLFVSWHKNGTELKGCIGTFSKASISENLPRYAIRSAFEDKRFDPITKEDLNYLHCAVSLLTNFEKGEDAYDWQVGKHGIIIELESNGESYRATYLPEVAHSRGWSQDETLKHLLKKAGCREPLSRVVTNIQLERYQSSKCEISYEEYLRLKKDKST